MTPEEIRAMHNGEAYQAMTADRETYWAFRDSPEFMVLREIAAQLAEQNQQLRDERYPGTVEHIACIIREPDGTLKLGTNTGELIELDANESNFLLVAMRRKPSEAKPS